MDHEARIRERAHTIWVSEGRLPGREHANWEQARRELEVPNPGQRLETDENNPGERPSDSAIIVGSGTSPEAPQAGVDSQSVGHLDDAADRRPSTGRSKLVGG